jgi:galactitol-specific phosphotransferase system IIB component
MRSSRTDKKRNKKTYIRNILVVFFVIVPVTAVTSSLALHYAFSEQRNIKDVPAVFEPDKPTVETFKYNIDIKAKQLYRVEIKKLDKYEDAEAQVAALKKKKLNCFIVKEQGFLLVYGLFMNESQANTVTKYLKRKNIDSTVNVINISEMNIKYDDVDITLIDLASAVDAAVLKILSEKAVLSLEGLYSDKHTEDKSLQVIVEQEAKLAKYLNYLKDIKTSEANAVYKANLENLIKEVLENGLDADGSYSYYNLQNSLLNQGEALRRFYEKLTV